MTNVDTFLTEFSYNSIADFKEIYEYKYIYGVFGVYHVNEISFILKYIVFSNEAVNPLSVLEDNDITPYCFGTSHEGQWGSFTSIELDDMDDDELYDFFSQREDAEEFYVED